jgi:hypothetical protein
MNSRLRFGNLDAAGRGGTPGASAPKGMSGLWLAKGNDNSGDNLARCAEKTHNKKPMLQ